MSVEQGSTVHDSAEPVPLQVYHRTKFKKYKNEEEDRSRSSSFRNSSSFFYLSCL